MQMKTIGFIGAGNMAEALVKGLLSADVFKKDRIIMSDVAKDRLSFVSSKFKIATTRSNAEVAKRSDLIVLAVKPNLIGPVIEEIRGHLNRKKVLISIAAGITTSFIREKTKKKIKIARVMPNTPALVLAGASVIFCNSELSPEERENVRGIFESVGIAHIVENEDLLDAVTGMSGSGPAYAAMFIEALSDGGVKMGLSRETALRLAAQTVYGTGKMVLEGGIHPAELREKVSSPAGTTIEGIHELEAGGFRGSVISAVEAATLRSKELSKGGK